jgi:hypothetical protein
MYSVLQRDSGTLLAIHDFDCKICSDSRTFYFIGGIDGLTKSNYHVERTIDLHNVVAHLPVCLPSVYGRYAGVSIRDDVLELAATDISAVEELYISAWRTTLRKDVYWSDRATLSIAASPSDRALSLQNIQIFAQRCSAEMLLRIYGRASECWENQKRFV